MNRDLVISALLIIAGVILAIALFGAGAFWKGRSSRHNNGPGRAASATASQHLHREI